MKFSYMYQLVLQQIQKRKNSYVFLFILIILTTFLQIFLVTIANKLGNDYFVAASFRDKNVMIIRNGDSLMDELEEKNIENVRVEEILQGALWMKNNIESFSFHVKLYGETISENSNLNVKGTDIRDAKIKDGAYPIMVPENSPLAEYYYSKETFDLYFSEPDLRVEGFMVNESFKPAKFYVCALIKYPYYHYYSLNQFPDRVIRLLYSSTNSNDLIITKDAELREGLFLSDVSHSLSEKGDVYRFVQITAEKGSEEYRSLYNMIKTKYTTISIQDVLDNEVESIAIVMNYIIALILVSLLSVFCLTGINLYLFEIVSKEYSLYFMCGSKWSDCIFIEAFRNFIVIFIPSLIGSLIAVVLIILDGTDPYLNWITLITSIFFVGLLFTVSTLYFLIKLKKTKPIENIRLMVKE